MRNRGQLIFGLSIVIFGLILLASRILNLSLWRFIWPICLIAIGIILILRQRGSTEDTAPQFAFARDLNRSAAWEVKNAEYWHFAGDFTLDLSTATLPPGIYHWRLFGFYHEIRLYAPKDVAVAVTTHTIVTEKRIFGEKEDLIFLPLEWQSEIYDDAPNKFIIDAYGFVVDVRISEGKGVQSGSG